MQIKLNGEVFELIPPPMEGNSSNIEFDTASNPAGTASIALLVSQRNLNPRQIAVEVNCQLIPREEFDNHTLAEGDSVEIVTLAGGG